MILFVSQGKGNKDRITVLSDKLLNELKIFALGKNPQDFVFFSERGGRLTTRTIQKVFENALKRSGVNITATFHSLRHF